MYHRLSIPPQSNLSDVAPDVVHYYLHSEIPFLKIQDRLVLQREPCSSRMKRCGPARSFHQQSRATIHPPSVVRIYNLKRILSDGEGQGFWGLEEGLELSVNLAEPFIIGDAVVPELRTIGPSLKTGNLKR